MNIIKYNAIFLLIIIASCNPSSDGKKTLKPVDKKMNFENRNEHFLNYMEFDETMQSEIDSVLQYGSAILPLVKETLYNGPSKTRLFKYEAQLKKTYADLYADSKYKPSMSEAEFIKLYTKSFSRTYKVRAIELLMKLQGGKKIIQEYKSSTSAEKDVLGYISRKKL